MDENGPTTTPNFVIEAAEAASIAAAAGKTLVDILPSLVIPAATALSRPSISKFSVAAAAVGPASGRIFVGVNVEFPGLPLHLTIHAEQFLVANLFLHREPQIPAFAVSAAPCGHCRQFLQEIRRAPDIQIFVKTAAGGSGDRYEPLLSLLPRRFGPDDLLSDDVPLLLENRHNGLVLSAGAEKCAAGDDILAAALEAANLSHAPYSGCAAGVALVDRTARVFKGSYMESAAYNPSLGPVQAAIVAYIVGGGGDYSDITAAVLVEEEGAAISQEETARMLLRSISPDCVFETFRCASTKATVKNVVVG